MSDAQDLDRSEDATPHKRDEARKRGQVARSVDLTAAWVLCGAGAYLVSQGGQILRALGGVGRTLFGLIPEVVTGRVDPPRLWQAVEYGVLDMGGLLLPVLAVMVAGAILGNVSQTGVILSLHPIRPDWQRVNPATGFKRVMSRRTVIDGIRGGLKLVVLGSIGFLAMRAIAPHLELLSIATTDTCAALAGAAITSLLVKMLLGQGLVALLDFGYVRREHARSLRMSRREVRDEHKNREGDPRIRARLRELRREALRRTRALQRTASADVVLANPTHIAVALQYRHGEMSAPLVVSKGAGSLASAIRKIAARKGIPVVRNPVLARALHAQVDLDEAVPPALYGDVARVLVWVLAMRKSPAATHTEIRS